MDQTKMDVVSAHTERGMNHVINSVRLQSADNFSLVHTFNRTCFLRSHLDPRLLLPLEVYSIHYAMSFWRTAKHIIGNGLQWMELRGMQMAVKDQQTCKRSLFSNDPC